MFLAGVSRGHSASGGWAAARRIVEEERRLFYVGITRAKEELILTTGPRPSAFLQSLPRTVERERCAAHLAGGTAQPVLRIKSRNHARRTWREEQASERAKNQQRRRTQKSSASRKVN